ncbi:hypothetical protein IEQ34_011217 [Dendrobium chrysotoxum]|uniref:Uncharacterized protein n=1 Tax=Dendrobium chrysotoxum TaxID=161865 RepID=A0AAV7GXN4_DENCH|nr:hypothetical protein IEQ34_011217 [Dendrobium chrysotoxum]
MRQAQTFLYANGKDQSPIAIELDKSLLKDLLFNQSSDKDVALASASMIHIPFAPVLQKLELTCSNYGSIRRFYIETTEDNSISLPLQQIMCESHPPEKTFRLKGSDHSPFFSKPQALHKFLVDIAKIPTASRKQTNHDKMVVEKGFAEQEKEKKERCIFVRFRIDGDGRKLASWALTNIVKE